MEMIAQELRRDRNLTHEAAERMVHIIRELYQILVRPQEPWAAHLPTAAALQPDAAAALGTLLDNMLNALLGESSGDGTVDTNPETNSGNPKTRRTGTC